MKLKFIATSPEDTNQLAADLARTLPHGSIVLLRGDLGAGKTALARALLRTLTGTPDLDVPSPTFNLVHTYESRSGTVWHFDLYRLKDPEEVYELGWEEALSAPLTLVEWPERLGALPVPSRRIVEITLQDVPDSPQSRLITLEKPALPAPRTAFIFAAGLGERMRPLTDTMPKPLVPVSGRPLLGFIFDHLERAGITRVILNTHYFPEQIERFLDPYRTKMEIRTSFEPDLLETGGGLKKALPLIDDDLFYAINGDALWTDGPALPALSRLALTFDPARMDALLLLQPLNAMTVTPGSGDYRRHPDGQLERTQDRTGSLMFTGIRLMHRRMMDGAPESRHSFLRQMDEAQRGGRLHGLVHNGEWHHISTPADAQAVTRHLQVKKESGG